jgi:hypothetical protein
MHLGVGGCKRLGGHIRSGEAEHLMIRADEFVNDGGSDEYMSFNRRNLHFNRPLQDGPMRVLD